MPPTDILSTKSAIPEKAGDGTPTTLLGAKSMIQYTLQAHQSNRNDCPTCGRQFDSPKALGPHFRAQHPDAHAVLDRVRRDFRPTAENALRTLHHDLGLRIEGIADRFDYPRDGLIEAFEKVGVKKRDWDVGDWHDEEPERAQKHSQEVASLGAPAREENGMAGVTGEDNPHYSRVMVECGSCGDEIQVKQSRSERCDELYCSRDCMGDRWSDRFTGQDHPNWRGGSHLIDAVKKQLTPTFHSTRRRFREGECCQCGVVGGELHTHHIVPISAGGTNESWNLMTLCASCHSEVEAHTRDLPGMEPVLTEEVAE